MKIKSNQNTGTVTFTKIENKILEIRGQKVMLDTDLAEIYGTTTKALNQAVKRNLERFPNDFMFKLTSEELSELVTICDHLKFSYQMPHAFTEQGALMLASILNSDIAINASVEIVRVFVKMRSMIIANKDLVKKINALEEKFADHDEKFRVVFDTIKQLMIPVNSKPKRPIGFQVRISKDDEAHNISAG